MKVSTDPSQSYPALQHPMQGLDKISADDVDVDSSDDEEDDEGSTDSVSDVSDSETSSDYDYSSPEDDDDDDGGGGSYGCCSMDELEKRYRQRKEKGLLNRGGSLLVRKPDVVASELQVTKENHSRIISPTTTTTTATSTTTSTSMARPAMQLDVDMSNIQLSEEDSKSMRNLFARMNSAKSMSYFQGNPEDEIVAIPKELEINHQTKQRRGSQDDLALLAVPDAQSPESLLADILVDLTTIQLSETFWEAYFAPVTDARKDAYTQEVVKAMRSQDLAQLKALYRQNRSMDACNAQGETLLHLACRRRNHALVKFLLEQGKVSPKARDDWGKTPLHELCWHSKPGKQHKEQFYSVKALIREAPELLFAKDKRGFTAFQYVPKDSWKDWRRFLERYNKLIRCKVQLIGFRQSRENLQATLKRANSTISILSGGKLEV